MTVINNNFVENVGNHLDNCAIKITLQIIIITIIIKYCKPVYVIICIVIHIIIYYI